MSQPRSTSSTSTFAPAFSSSFAVAAPMPFAPPVTTAVLSFRSRAKMRCVPDFRLIAVSILARMFDLVIRDALLLDGLGSPPRRGGVAVKDGKIVEVGRILGSARRIVNADGLALMPGIIDNHTHYDAQLTWDPWASPSPALGVTTAVIGNCGFTIAPCRPRDRDLVMKNLTQVEGMSLAVLRAGVRWDFETVPQYLDMLERQGSALNVAVFAGHSSIRTYVMGEAATSRAANAAEIESMRRIVVDAMGAGA